MTSLRAWINLAWPSTIQTHSAYLREASPLELPSQASSWWRLWWWQSWSLCPREGERLSLPQDLPFILGRTQILPTATAAWADVAEPYFSGPENPKIYQIFHHFFQTGSSSRRRRRSSILSLSSSRGWTSSLSNLWSDWIDGNRSQAILSDRVIWWLVNRIFPVQWSPSSEQGKGLVYTDCQLSTTLGIPCSDTILVLTN